MKTLFLFLGIMWVLILVGGGFIVTVLGSMRFDDLFFGSVIKGIIAISLVVLWIVILSQLKKRIFRKNHVQKMEEKEQKEKLV